MPPTPTNSAPRLRTRLIAILVATLGIACLIIGLSSYITLKNSLTTQLEGRLDEAIHRATMVKGGPKNPLTQDNQNQTTPETDTSNQNPTCDPTTSGHNPLRAPGQGAGTLILCTDTTTTTAGYLDAQGNIQELSQQDITTLHGISTPGTSQKVTLETGDYLVESVTTATGETIITGLPLAETNRTLGTLIAVTTGGSLTVMLLAGWLGSWVIRRTMQPLERVSSIATYLSRLNLAHETLPATSRVTPQDSNPNTEVGAVGHALNQLLDNVDSALTARQKTEDQMRTFIADASHELRTPLAAIKGYTDMLTWTENLSDQGQTYLSRVSTQTTRMGRLVEDLLLLARLDEGHQPTKSTVDLGEILLENITDLQITAPSHTWELNLPQDPIEVHGDPTQLQQVILNLLSNARKHTDEGTRITAGLTTSTNGQDAIITVEDRGQGIDPDFLPTIFNRFTRADAARSGSDGTTGLGLPIVKAIIEAHQGSISVSSRPGHTQFTVTLPLLAPGQEPLTA